MIEGGDLERRRHVASQRRRERGHGRAHVVGVRDDDHIRLEDLVVLREERLERAGPRLLLPLHEDRDADPEVVPERREGRGHRGDVGDDARLVVRRPSPEQPVALQGGLERRGAPELVAARRLDVVVRVEQDGRPSGSGGATGDDGRRAGRVPSSVGSPRGGPRRCRSPGAAERSATASALVQHRLVGEPQEGDRRDPHEPTECTDRRRQPAATASRTFCSTGSIGMPVP